MKIKNIWIINFILLFLTVILVIAAGVFLMKNFNSETALAEEDDDILPPVISNINVSELSATSSIITWETNELADSLINYGLDKNYGVIRDPRADKIEHMIILEELLPNTDYYYRITSSDLGGNQGISSDFSFKTLQSEEMMVDIGRAEEVLEQGEGGLKDEVVEDGDGGLNEKVLEEVEILERTLELIENITLEESLDIVNEKIQQKVEEEVQPPTIILDMADIEIGTDYVIIRWLTDKESNSMIALAEENDYNQDSLDPYIWKEGEPEELVLEHEVYVNGLDPSTIYHFQVSSQSSLGLTGRSSDRNFKTKSILPEIYNIQLAKIEEESVTIRYSTNVPCSSIVEYTNLNTNHTKLEGNSSYLTVHSMKLTNLIFDTYYSAVIKVESDDGEKSESEPLAFITTRDEYPPIISKVNTESTIYPGSDNKIQTIASWRTDEPAICQLFYHQGLVVEEADSLQIEEDYAVKHVEVITNFLPSTVYKFWIVCDDEAGNSAKSEDFTMLTPSQEESIIDIIIKNFESSFGWVKKLKI